MRVVARVPMPSDVNGVRVTWGLRDLRRVYAVHTRTIAAYCVERAPLTMPMFPRTYKQLHLLIIDRMFHT